MTSSDELHARVRAFIDASLAGPVPAGRFDALALEMARWQVERVPAAARLARARAVDLGAATRADLIPALPADVFRLARVAAHPPADDVRVFRTSGTTHGARGEHAFRTLATYERAALAWGEAMLWPDGPGLDALVLAPGVGEAPDSSLGFMLDLFAARLARAGRSVRWLIRGGELDLAGVAAACADQRRRGAPAIVLGTSFALVHLLDRQGGADLGLPAGSRVMQTGGFKGRSREVEPDELRRAIALAFAVPEARVVGEYGMTELSSQLYEGQLAGRGEAGGYLAPPWVRVGAADPGTLDPLPDGVPGIARIVDLANVDSAVAVQTADRVVVEGGVVRLLGRAPGATPRGCSLAIDEMLGEGR